MHNLSVHKGGRVKEIVEDRGCELSRTCRPTRQTSAQSREAFAKLEAPLRRAGARTPEAALVEATGRALDAVTATGDARGFFEHRGYRAAAQLP
jgi:hypothetical protein